MRSAKLTEGQFTALLGLDRYNYRIGNPKLPRALPSGVSFEEFWQSSDWTKNRNQIGHFTDDDGICRFNLIIPHEKLDRVFPVVMNQLGLQGVKLYKKNVSRGATQRGRNTIPASLADEINAYYASDYSAWAEANRKIEPFLQQAATGSAFMKGDTRD